MHLWFNLLTWDDDRGGTPADGSSAFDLAGAGVARIPALCDFGEMARAVKWGGPVSSSVETRIFRCIHPRPGTASAAQAGAQEAVSLLTARQKAPGGGSQGPAGNSRGFLLSKPLDALSLHS